MARKESESVMRLRGAKRLLDDAFKAFNAAKTETDKKWYIDCIQTIALSVKNEAGEVEKEIKGEM